jgi:hypothetical protein
MSQLVPTPGACTDPTRFVLYISEYVRPRIFNLFDQNGQETNDKSMAHTCVFPGFDADAGRWVAYFCTPDEVEYVQ